MGQCKECGRVISNICKDCKSKLMGRELYERGLGSLVQCSDAMTKCDGDVLLAEGCLKYNGCAINVRPKKWQTREEAYSAWVMDMAHEWKSANGQKET